VHRGAGDTTVDQYFANRTSSVAWHSDVSYEQQPPGTTFLYILDKPETGGDTLFVDAVEAYRRLSPLFQERLHGLKATHSGIEQVNAAAARGGIKRREPVVNVHPIVRTHPVTGEKAIYVNPQCEFSCRPLFWGVVFVLVLTLLSQSHARYCGSQEGRVGRVVEVLVRSSGVRS
jgi:sulfonate dioxygenase